jgi:hypothetical protein
MSDGNQTFIPDSFTALFRVPGRLKLTASHAHIAERAEYCEDLAQMLVDTARTRLWELQIGEDEVLQRMWRGLQGGAAGVDDAEAGWVITRLAELLGWQALTLDPGDERG